MDMTACNYNPQANMELYCTYAQEYYDFDGECIIDTDADLICDGLEIGGCTDSTAVNYNADGTDDNRTCEYDQEAIAEIITLISNNLFEPLPNPFNPIVTILYSIKDLNQINIGVYTLNELLVETLTSNPVSLGYHSISWNVEMYPSAIYLV